MEEKQVKPKKFIDRDKLKEKSHRLIRDAIIVAFILVLVGYVVTNIEFLFRSPHDAAAAIQSLGYLGPVVAILILALEVIVAPIPGFIVAIAAGFAFGGFWGSIYTYAGNLIGTMIAFWLSRRFGRPLIEHLVSKNKLNKYDCFFKEKGKALLWVVYLVPVFPADVVTFMAGLTDLKWEDFIIIVSYAFIPYVIILNLFGASLVASGLSQIITMLGIIVFLAITAGLWGYNYLTKTGDDCAT